MLVKMQIMTHEVANESSVEAFLVQAREISISITKIGDSSIHYRQTDRDRRPTATTIHWSPLIWSTDEIKGLLAYKVNFRLVPLCVSYTTL